MIVDWNEIDTILLDMDGTLLDRQFDDHFWLYHVPKRWAQKHSKTVEYAKTNLIELFKSQENTLNWTDLDYWSDKLGLDIPLLKIEMEHLIAVHPFVTDFLLFLKQHNKSIWLVTNAHSKTLELKMEKTKLAPYFTGIISAHTVGLPKEDNNFWKTLQQYICYKPERTLLGEDSETNLMTAKNYAIKYLIYISRYSSIITPRASEHFSSIEYFNQLIPNTGIMQVSIR